MPKLHLKRTPEEEAAHQWRKKQKKEAKAKRPHRYHSYTDNHTHSERSVSPSHKRRRTGPAERDRTWDAPGYASDDDPEYGPPPPTAGPSSFSPPPDPNAHRYKPDYDAIRAELEEQRFREKMCGAFEDDERLDSLEARLNDFAHVPGRWRSSGAGKAKARELMDEDGDGFLKMDPRYMDEEEYAEWIRAGMYRKTHAEEHAEQLRKKALKAERRAQDKALKAETERLAKAAEEERRRKKQEKENRRWDYARQAYDNRWKELLSNGAESDGTSVKDLKFEDIPWPVFAAHPKVDKRTGRTTLVLVSPEDLTPDAISAFLLPPSTSVQTASEDQERKERKEKLRETFLRFHPDKFEGRFMRRVREGERDRVREAIGMVVRVLNTLMGEGT